MLAWNILCYVHTNTSTYTHESNFKYEWKPSNKHINANN